MTNVYLEADGSRYTIVCKGHASPSPEVCAGISVLVQSIAGWTHNSDAKIITEKLEDGDAVLRFSGGAECRAVFDLAVVGFSQLASSFPELVNVAAQEI